MRASPAAICIESDDDVVEPEVEKEKTQSLIEAPLSAGQVTSPRPWSEVRLGRSRSKRPVGSPLCIHESREQCSLTQTRCPMTYSVLALAKVLGASNLALVNHEKKKFFAGIAN